MAVNCWLDPTVIVGFCGVTAMDSSVGGVMVNAVLPVTFPDVAEMVVLPTAAPVASPLAETPPTAGDEELHVTDAVRVWVVPSL